jgi:hypothetical protein
MAMQALPMPKPGYTFGQFSIDPSITLAVPQQLKQVWPDTFVEEGSLTKHIFLLRKTLGENSAGTPYIETVPKRGYRFIGAVERANSMAVSITAEERTAEHIVVEETEVADPRPRWIQWKLGALCAFSALAGGLVWSGWTRVQLTPVRSLLVLPFANIGQAESEYFADGLTEELISIRSHCRRGGISATDKSLILLSE